MTPPVAKVIRAASLAVIACVAVWLLLAGLLKLQDTSEFARTLVAQAALPPEWSSTLSWAIPSTEVILSVFALVLLLHAKRCMAASLLSIAFLAFASYLTWLHLHPPPQPAGCGCGFRSTYVENWSSLAAQNSFIALGLIVSGLGTRLGRLPACECAGTNDGVDGRTAAQDVV